MSEPIAAKHPNIVTPDQLPDRNLRWPRLVAYIIWNGWPCALGLFIVESVSYLWKHGLILSGGSKFLVVLWLAKAFGFGLFCGLLLRGSMLVAQAVSSLAKANSSQRPGA